MARVAALACELGSPIVELTVRADNPAQQFYLRTGFQPLPQCLTYVLAGPALAALPRRTRTIWRSPAERDAERISDVQSSRGCQIISANTATCRAGRGGEHAPDAEQPPIGRGQRRAH